MYQWAAEEVPHVDVRAETRVFVDYWRGASGQRATKVDWLATWRNWMRRAERDAPHGPSTVNRRNGKPTLTPDQQLQLAEDIARRKGYPVGEAVDVVSRAVDKPERQELA